LAAAATCDDASLDAGLWQAVGAVHMHAGRVTEAVTPMRKAMEVHRRRGRSHLVVIAVHNYGEVLLANGQLAEAETALLEATDLALEIGDHASAAYSEWALAEIDMRRGEWSTAQARLEHARQTHETANTVDGLAETLRGLGELKLATGDPVEAVDHFEQAHRIWDSLGLPIYVARMLARLELAHRACGDEATAEEYRAGWQGILDELELDDACLLLPPFLADSSPVLRG
jgi:tetratricopeptide (TPR) repeat protein